MRVLDFLFAFSRNLISKSFDFDDWGVDTHINARIFFYFVLKDRGGLLSQRTEGCMCCLYVEWFRGGLLSQIRKVLFFVLNDIEEDCSPRLERTALSLFVFDIEEDCSPRLERGCMCSRFLCWMIQRRTALTFCIEPVKIYVYTCTFDKLSVGHLLFLSAFLFDK